MSKKTLLTGMLSFAGCLLVSAQQVGIKTNLLYWATTTPNIGTEFAVGKKHTAQVFFGLNPWKQSGGDQSSIRHWVVQPEYRYWFKQNYQGWFGGFHALGGQYNAGGVKFPFGLLKTLRDHRYEGWFVGGGVTGGYQWKLANRLNLEASLGLGYIYSNYDKFKCGTCGEKLYTRHKNYVGPTKVALSLVYLIGPKPKTPKVVEPVPVEPVQQITQLAFVQPVVEAVKIRHLDKRAYIDFPVDKIELHVDYRRNPAQLDSIISTINALKDDKNLEVSSINIHGYASPESPYSHNDYLAKNRAKTLTDYVRRMVQLPSEVFTVSSTPEDWEGLRAYIKDSNLEHKNEILAIANDEQLNPDAREAKIKKQYPTEYRFMLTTWYPALRHSDYHITYKVKPFDVAEAKEILKTKPQQLSLNEMFMVAQTYEPGSKDFNEVMETAVRMFPTDPVANLNAAILRLNKGDYEDAKPYLDKAGSSKEAEAAREVYNEYENKKNQ